MSYNSDPITSEIIQNSVQAIADEMFVAMRKTAMSSIIYEVLDMATGITDAKGRIACSGTGGPGFIGVLDKSVQTIIEKFESYQAIKPEDVFITNDPYYGGVTHLNDLVLAMPVFCNGNLIAWTANIAHNSDVGGMAPGSLSGDATEIFQEGLRLPVVKLIDSGEIIQSVMDIITVNSRMPEILLGDVWAAIASLKIGAKRLEILAEKYSIEIFIQSIEDFLNYGEASVLKEMELLPKGTFKLSEPQDDGRIFNVIVSITDTEFLVDLRDNPGQDIGPTNTSRDGTLICAQSLFKSLTCPNLPMNDGSFRPLKVLTKEGSIFHAKEPAASGFYFETRARISDLIWRCLAPHIPNRLPAGHFSSVGGTFISGVHPVTGRQYTIIEPQLGGWGASDNRDGNTCIFSGGHGETYNTPAEISESRNGLFVESMELNIEPGGEGKFIGGRGLKIEYQTPANGGLLTASFTRSKIKPWNLKHGKEGSGNYLAIVRTDGTEEYYSFVSELRLNQGDVIRIVTSCGGGYGNPKNRDSDAVRLDLKNEILSRERCLEIYGLEA